MKQKTFDAFLIMVIPAFLLFFTFHTFPALQSLFYSFTNWRGYGIYKFVGLKNYLNVFADARVWEAYLFTFKFAITATLLVNILSLLLAMALNSTIPLRRIFRAIYFFPNILSILIIGFIFRYMFVYLFPQAGAWFVNAFHLGQPFAVLTENILGKPNLAWLGIVAVVTWQGIAFNTLLYLAGLQTVPDELFEAASLDGAGKISRFWHITLPIIMPFVTINMVLAMKGFLMVFDPIMALTGGGPGRATEAIALVIYRGGFQGGQFAYQSANAILYFIIILLVSLFQIKVLQKREVSIA
ncbi:carbohydrate ABC transporter membrane protein 1, CUT1 family [Candidatus Moduliflexus flocculans]|uniref:Carbohydrate ABC transporter membrane protein 1, CUT1 family n=1 Tax=Candidatus Moduliflexus flocculans TaxID=1499966 RepID=A0A0S6VWU6_9BACT|nr:carbohydrate ABC transporter membrane protein 1, CUT1 family [Candidatus Moduliflexus flocculans]